MAHFEITIERPGKYPRPEKEVVEAADRDAAKQHPNRVKGSRIVEVRKCTGEAHSNAFIDNCMSCAPRWGWVAVTPKRKVA